MFIDIIFVIIATTGFFTGYRKGLVGALINIVSIIVALLAAAKFSPGWVGILEGILPELDKRIYLIVGFLITFMVFMAGIKWLGRNLERGMREVHLDFINKLGGGVLFFALNTVIYSTALWILRDFNLFNAERYTDSVVYPTLEQIPLILREYLDAFKPIFQEFWEKLSDAGRELKEGIQDHQ